MLFFFPYFGKLIIYKIYISIFFNIASYKNWKKLNIKFLNININNKRKINYKVLLLKFFFKYIFFVLKIKNILIINLYKLFYFLYIKIKYLIVLFKIKLLK